MSARKRRQYTASEKEAAVRDAGEMGVCAAAKKHGIPQSCVSRWTTDAGRKSGGGVAGTSFWGTLDSATCEDESIIDSYLPITAPFGQPADEVGISGGFGCVRSATAGILC